jgi:hypothetical protein
MGCVVMHNLISRMILLPQSTSNSSSEFVDTLLVGGIKLYRHQYYIQQVTSSLLLQGITGQEKKFSNSLILKMRHKKYYCCATDCTRHVSRLK